VTITRAANQGGTQVQGINVAGTNIDPTGTTDSATAIQTLITSAGAGASLWWPAGTYLVSTALAPLDRQVWAGPGVIKATSGNTTSVVAITGKTSVQLNLTIDGALATAVTGNGSGVSTVRHGVNITGSSQYCRVSGRVQNVPGTAVRIVDASDNTCTADIDNVYYGVVVGSVGSGSNPTGGAHRNVIQGARISRSAYNAIFFSGRTDSASGPNICLGNQVTGVTLTKIGDSGIEIGQGSVNTTVTGVLIDGTTGDGAWTGAYNGILIRDARKAVVAGFNIRNFPSFTNGSGSLLTLGNGIYLWPQYTGLIDDISISTGTIEGCTRGVFAQGQQGTAPNDALTGNNTGSSGVVNAGCTISDVVVDGTTLGNLSGSWTTVQNAISSHGFYLPSVTGFTLTACVARNCQNDGFRVGDTGVQSQYAQYVTLVGCRAYNNGQQVISGQTYQGFYLAGTSSQIGTQLTGCRAHDFATSGAKTQHFGFRWNSNGGQPFLADCQASGHTGTYTNGGTSASYNGVGTDTSGGLGGLVSLQGGSYTVGSEVSTVIWNGTTAQTVTLPSATFSGTRRIIWVRNVGTVTLTIAKAGGGTLTKTSLTAGEDYVYVTDGTNWY